MNLKIWVITAEQMTNMSKKEIIENPELNNLKQTCLEEIYKQRTIIFDECVMPNQRTVVDGETIELRPITYIDLPISSPKYLRAVSSFIHSLKHEVGFDALCGIATQGTPYAFAASQEYNIPAIYFRKEPQQYGTLLHLSGKLEKGSRVLIVDNLVYSGNTMASALEALGKTGLDVVGAFTVVDFDTAIDRVSLKTRLNHLITIEKLYEYLIQHHYFPKSIVPYIRSFIQDQTLFHSTSALYKEYLTELKKVKDSS